MNKATKMILSLGAALAFTDAALPAAAAQFVNIGTGPTGGTYYPVGAGIAKI